MICRKCGEVIGDNDRFCSLCGAPQWDDRPETPSVLNPRHSHYDNCAHTETKTVGFLQAIALFFRNYTNFRGRSRRSEYWWFCLFNIIVSGILTIAAPDVTGLWSVIILIPTLSLAVRRLHDIGRSGWWYLIGLLPLAGGIILIIWFCKDSDPQTNQWGASPKH